MSKMMLQLLGWLDRRAEGSMRSAARLRGRRSFLFRLGHVIVGGALLPMLPFERSAGASLDQFQDNSKCDYWAYCSLSGTLCNACGGTDTQCPPGTQSSLLSWVGTCINPKEKKSYLVSYGDCCGKVDCDASEEAMCSRSEGERPGYRIGAYNDANWCMANSNRTAHCSIAVLVGVADDA